MPPAWTDVWICPSPEGHLQATGRDARGRKQYRYHDQWRSVRDANKYSRLRAFGESLPRVRERIAHDLALRGLPRDKVLAAAARILDETLIRVGNAEYARENESFGLTTLLDDHVELDGSTLRFRFRGKSGKEHDIEFRDARLSRIVKRCQDIPGEQLFQYVGDDGECRGIESGDVNDYLRDAAGAEYTAKDFRTWGGTVLAAEALVAIGSAEDEREQRRNVAAAIDEVAERLGNTPAVCRACYVHPGILESYASGDLVRTWGQRLASAAAHPVEGLDPEEQAVVGLLRWLERQAAAQAA